MIYKPVIKTGVTKMEGQVDGYKMHRSTSVRLRKRRDQARKEFLKERKSGEFGYSSHHDGWSYVSFQSPENGTQPNRPGPVSLGLNSVRCHPQHPIIGGARSLGFIPPGDDDDHPSSYYPPVHMAVPGQTSRQVMSDTEDYDRGRRRGRRGGEEDRERKLWRKSVIGLGEAERSRDVVYKDFGMIDTPDQLEAVSEIQSSSHRQSR